MIDMKRKVIIFSLIVAVLIGIATTFTVIAINSNKVDTEPEESVNVKYDENTEGVAFLNKDAKLSDIKRIKGVVNVYVFWGNGCPHCKALWEWLDSQREKYEGKVAVYGFEVFNSDKNRLIMDDFVDAVGDKDVNSVPYIVIGNKSIGGFTTGATTGKKISELIDSTKDSGKDIYFDKIKK